MLSTQYTPSSLSETDLGSDGLAPTGLQCVISVGMTRYRKGPQRTAKEHNKEPSINRKESVICTAAFIHRSLQLRVLFWNITTEVILHWMIALLVFH